MFVSDILHDPIFVDLPLIKRNYQEYEQTPAYGDERIAENQVKEDMLKEEMLNDQLKLATWPLDLPPRLRKSM